MSLTRRAFLRRAALGGGTLTVLSLAVPLAALEIRPRFREAARTLALSRGPVVTFFDGQLWLDTSGSSVPYRAPAGARSAAFLTDLPADQLHTLYGRI